MQVLRSRRACAAAAIAAILATSSTFARVAAAEPEPRPEPENESGSNPVSNRPPSATTSPEPPTPTPETGEAGATGSSSALTVRASSEVGAYADTNHVYVFTPTVAGTVSNPLEGYSLSGRYLVDVVSAASVDIVSTASRRWEEVRHVGALDGTYRLGDFDLGANVNVSSEPDYLSLGAAGTIAHDFFAKNVTALVGFNHRHDVIGRSETPFSVFSRKLDINGLKGGLTTVLDKASTLSFVGDLIFENGDSSKPYRYVPMFTPAIAATLPKGASIDLVNAERTSARVLEQLPTARTRYAIAGRFAHRFAESTLRLEERLYTDSWGLKSSTSDALVLFDLSRRVELGPHLRFHGQMPVNFWQRAYVVNTGFDFPALRTGDREIGPLLNFTGGGSFRFFLGADNDPRKWTLGLDGGVTQTQYLDDLFLTSRTSFIAALSLEVEL